MQERDENAIQSDDDQVKALKKVKLKGDLSKSANSPIIINLRETVNTSLRNSGIPMKNYIFIRNCKKGNVRKRNSFFY